MRQVRGTCRTGAFDKSQTMPPCRQDHSPIWLVVLPSWKINEWMERIIPSIIFFQTTNQPWLCWINISRKPSNLWNNQRSLQMGYCISEMFGNAIWPKSARLSSGWASAHWFAGMYRLTDMAMEPIATALAKLKIYESYVYIYICT